MHKAMHVTGCDVIRRLAYGKQIFKISVKNSLNVWPTSIFLVASDRLCIMASLPFGALGQVHPALILQFIKNARF